VGGESRFAAAVSRRLESLGALTRGDRRAGGGGFDLSESNFDSQLGRRALRRVFDHISQARARMPPLRRFFPPLHPAARVRALCVCAPHHCSNSFFKRDTQKSPSKALTTPHQYPS